MSRPVYAQGYRPRTRRRFRYLSDHERVRLDFDGPDLQIDQPLKTERPSVLAHVVLFSLLAGFAFAPWLGQAIVEGWL